LISIIFISSTNAYINIYTFKKHTDKDIQSLKDTYLREHQEKIKSQVDTVIQTIDFQINKVEEFTKERLNERIQTALKMVNFIYSQKKDTFTREQMLKLVSKHFSVLTYDKDGYLFAYKTKEKIMIYHPTKKFIGKDISKFKDKKNQNLSQLYANKLLNNKIAYAKIFFTKPSDTTRQYPKLVAITKFEPLGITIGTGIYLDEITAKVKKLVLEQFNNNKMDKNSYLFFMKLNNINGGINYASMLMNPNRPELIGKQLDDSVKDASGKYYRKDYLKLLRKKGNGFLKYYYKKPYVDVQKPKMSYFTLQKKWNWIIASGFYYDDLDKEISKIRNELEKYSNKVIMKTLTWILLLSLFSIVIAIYISSRINKRIISYTTRIEELNTELKNSMKIISEHVVISKTNLKGKIIYASDAFCKLSGYSKNELVGKPHNIVRHPDMPKSAFKDLWTTIKDNKTWNGEVKNLKKDGSFYWFIANISPEYDIKGKKVGYMAIRTDITAKKQYEDEHKKLIQSEKLASMGELVGNIAHQWRQPLSVIATAASALKLKKELDMLEKNDIIEYSDKIESTAQTLSKTIDSFKTIINENKIKTLFLLSDELSTFKHLVQEDIKDNDINIITQIDNNLEIFGYENDLTKCYINIFNNSKDAFIQNNLHTKLVFITGEIIDNNIIITFKDNAGGIDKDIINKIFEPYFTTKHQSQGTGLGLSMIYNLIINDMNGLIEVSNAVYTYEDIEYRGAEFKIILPL